MIEACIPRLCVTIRDIWFLPEFSVRENWLWNEAPSVCYYSVTFTFVCVCVSQCLPAETINIFDMFVFVYDFLSEYVPQAHYLFTLQPQPHFLSAPVKQPVHHCPPTKSRTIPVSASHLQPTTFSLFKAFVHFSSGDLQCSILSICLIW